MPLQSLILFSSASISSSLAKLSEHFERREVLSLLYNKEENLDLKKLQGSRQDKRGSISSYDVEKLIFLNMDFTCFIYKLFEG